MSSNRRETGRPPEQPDPYGPAWDMKHRPIHLCSYNDGGKVVLYDPDDADSWMECDVNVEQRRRA